ncbi:MAG: hypothetical protein ACHQZR_03855 [Candidatus Limnocylindrales bacterium]
MHDGSDDGGILASLLRSGRAAVVLGVLFATAGVIYLVLNHGTSGADLGGPALLLILAVAMTFGFWILLKNSDDL